MGTHQPVLSMSYPMNTNTAEFRWFSKILGPCALDKRSLGIVRVTLIVACWLIKCCAPGLIVFAPGSVGTIID